LRKTGASFAVSVAERSRCRRLCWQLSDMGYSITELSRQERLRWQ
jgi:hypothetical protein